MKPIKFGTFLLVAVIVITQYACLSAGTQKQAEKLIQEKDYPGAVELYQALIDSKPGTSDARKAQLDLAKVYIEKVNRPEEGAKVYQNLIDAAPESEEAVDAHWHLGVYYFKAKNYPSAQKSFDAIVNQFPHLERSHNAQLMLAKSYEESRNYKVAAEIYENVANRHPEDERAAQALINRARIQKQHLKDEEEAKRTYQSLVKRYGKIGGTEVPVNEAKQELRVMGASIPQPTDPAASRHNSALERRKKPRGRERPDAVEFSSETEAETDSDFGVHPQEVMSNFSGLGPGGTIQTDEQGTYYNAMLTIAKFMFESEKYRDAGALYRRGIELAKQEGAGVDPYDYVRLSICYRKLGLHQRARELLKIAIKRDKQVLESVITTGTNQYSDEEYELAIETYNSVMGLNRSRDPGIHWQIGLAYKKMGKPRRAVKSFERAIVAKTGYTDALQSLAGVLHYELKDTRRAKIFQALVDARGETYAGEKELGDLNYKYGNYPWAKLKYEAAARIAGLEKKAATSSDKIPLLDNRIVYTRVHAAMAAYKNGMEDESQTMIAGLEAEYPNHPLIPYGYGRLALLQGDADTAISAFKASVEQDSRFFAAPLVLGETYISQGFEDEAVALWKAFLENNPGDPLIRRRLEALIHPSR